MMELEMAIREYMLGRPVVKIEREEEDFMGEIVDANRGIIYIIEETVTEKRY